MLKRVRWIGMGAVLGVGGSLWAQVTLRRRVARLRPAAVASRLAGDLGRDLRGAVAEGRQAMHEREQELRRRLEPPQR